jgi:molybdopterin/thiamine biosynthesis adenylyltransferase
MTLYDADTIEEHNLATQSYGPKDVGKDKVTAVLEQLSEIEPENKHEGVAQMYDGRPIEADIIVSAVDSLDARRTIATALIENDVSKPIIDGRVGREQVEAYYFPTAKEWLAQLPDEGDEDPCGARFTAYTANIAAGLLANNVKRLLMGQQPPSRIIYDAATSVFIKQ